MAFSAQIVLVVVAVHRASNSPGRLRGRTQDIPLQPVAAISGLVVTGMEVVEQPVADVKHAEFVEPAERSNDPGRLEECWWHSRRELSVHLGQIDEDQRETRSGPQPRGAA